MAATNARETTGAAGAGGVTQAERRAKLRFMEASVAGCGKGQLERKENRSPQAEGDDPADGSTGSCGTLPECQRAVAGVDAAEGGGDTAKHCEGDKKECRSKRKRTI